MPPTLAHDLIFHGGKTIKDLTYTNFYVGADAWDPSDIRNIDRALDAAMSEPTLNNVMAQYFTGVPTTRFVQPQTLPGPALDQMTKEDLEGLVSTLHRQGKLSGVDFSSTVFNFMLPRGTVLSDDPIAGEHRGGHAARRRPVDEDDKASWLEGLGGFHGSVEVDGTTIYYAVGVYSEASDDQSNGIPVFDAPWKNVVATFYHELNEPCTDPDVEQVINGGPAPLLGWNSRQGEECGDFPVFEANPLTKVFQEVAVAHGAAAPVQFQYSNFVHGPEGPGVATSARQSEERPALLMHLLRSGCTRQRELFAHHLLDGGRQRAEIQGGFLFDLLAARQLRDVPAAAEVLNECSAVDKPALPDSERGQLIG